MADDDLWTVVVDNEGRHSVWRADRTIPTGWTATRHGGSRAECIETIDHLWTNPRPKSLAAAMSRPITGGGLTPR